MKSDINDMLIFLTVVETGGFTAAGDRLGIPKANVSRKLSRLEDRLGVRLLERTTRSQHLTEAGKRYLDHCKRIETEIDLAESAIAEESQQIRGKLTIGTSISLGHELLKPCLSQFMQRYPDIDLQVSLTNQRVDLIEEGFDLLIRVGELADSGLVAKRLGSVKKRIYASTELMEKLEIDGKTSKSPASLNDRDLVLMGNINRQQVFELFKQTKTQNLRQTIKVNPRLLVDDFALAKQATVDGLGFGLFPDYMCQKEVDAGLLVPVFEQWHTEAFNFYALYPQHRTKIPKVKAFVDFISEVFSKRLA